MSGPHVAALVGVGPAERRGQEHSLVRLEPADVAAGEELAEHGDHLRAASVFVNSLAGAI